jgi:hypothetical protein
MRFWTHRAVYTSLIAVVAVAVAVMLPIGAFTRRWLYIATPSDIVVRNAHGAFRTADDSVSTFGVLSYCHDSATQHSCQRLKYDPSIPELPFDPSCDRDHTSMKHRMNTAAAFAIIAFLLSLPLAVATVLSASASAYQRFGWGICDLVILGDGQMTRMIEMVLSWAVFFFGFIAVAVYGGTIDSWANCGQHYCDAVGSIAASNAARVQFPAGLTVTYDFLVSCGFGYSFAFVVSAVVFAFALLLLITVDFVTLPLGTDPVESAGQRGTTGVAASKLDAPLPSSQSGVVDDDANSAASCGRTEEPRDVVTGGQEEHRERTIAHTDSEGEDDDPKEQQLEQPHSVRRVPPEVSTAAREPERTQAVERTYASSSSSESIVVVGSPTRQAPVLRETVHETVAETAVNRDGQLETKQRVVTSTVHTPVRYAGSSSRVLLPEGDDWEYDPDEDLYWSPSQQLFFDTASGHFYDPSSGAWFNPVLQRWYQL